MSVNFLAVRLYEYERIGLRVLYLQRQRKWELDWVFSKTWKKKTNIHCFGLHGEPEERNSTKQHCRYNIENIERAFRNWFEKLKRQKWRFEKIFKKIVSLKKNQAVNYIKKKDLKKN